MDLQAASATEAIRLLADSLAHLPGVADVTKLVTDVLAREAVLPTYLGHGVALPHARTDAVTARTVAVGRAKDGVAFGAKGEKAQLIVLVGCPRHEVNSYLAFSKQLISKLGNETTRAQLLATEDPAVFLRLLGLDAEPPGSAAAS